MTTGLVAFTGLTTAGWKCESDYRSAKLSVSVYRSLRRNRPENYIQFVRGETGERYYRSPPSEGVRFSNTFV